MLKAPMNAPLTDEQRVCLQQLSTGDPVDQIYSVAVLEQLQGKGLLEITVQTLPMLPIGRRYRITPLGEQTLKNLT